MCIVILYATWISCITSTEFDFPQCGEEKDFRPIYTMYECNGCSEATDFTTNFRKMMK